MKTVHEIDSVNESKGAWREHVYSSYLRARLDGNKAIALQSLINKCQVSTDPAVQQAYGNYAAVVAQLRLLLTGEA